MPGMGKTILKRALYYPITCRNRSCMCGTHTGLSRSLFVRNKSSFNVSDSILLIMYRLWMLTHLCQFLYAKMEKGKNECRNGKGYERMQKYRNNQNSDMYKGKIHTFGR